MTTAAMSDYLEGKFIDYVLRSGTFASPASVYLALFTATPSDAGGGTEVASANAYARKQLTGAFDACHIYQIEWENRNLLIENENRIFAIDEEQRNYSIPFEDRIYEVSC